MDIDRNLLAIASTLPENPSDLHIEINNALVELYMRGNLEVVIDLADINGNVIKFQYKDLD